MSARDDARVRRDALGRQDLGISGLRDILARPGAPALPQILILPASTVPADDLRV